MKFDFSKILVVAPHTDDAELGCAGLISSRIKQGARVVVCALSVPPPPFQNNDCETLKNEHFESLSSLGVAHDDILVSHFTHRIFPDQRQEILDYLLSVKNFVQPSLVICPSSCDKHQDHHVVHQEVKRAFKDSSILGYDLPWNSNKFKCDLFYEITRHDLDNKISALRNYNSQSNRNYFEKSFIEGLAIVRGTQAGVAYAESFECIRLVVKN